MSDTTYPAPLRIVHWTMAVLIFAALGIGVWSRYLPRSAFRAELMDFHKSLGVTVLALIALRIVVRLLTRAPPYRPPLGRFNHVVASAVHGALYLVMIAMPLSGYVHSMAGGHGFRWFGLFDTPNLVAASVAAVAGAGKAHYVLAFAISALLIAHVTAALWHGLVRRDRVLARMAPGAP